MSDHCCPKFDPEPWDQKSINWENKLFLQDRVRSFLHIPLNFSAVMKRNMQLICTAGAEPDEMIVLADENSLWGADVFLAVTKEVPGAKLATISGNFLSRVFEGPYQDIRKWLVEMNEYVKEQEHEVKKLYFYYTTCPKCAKAYGKNYVVLLAQI